jgi:DNA end-binding protein Ku
MLLARWSHEVVLLGGVTVIVKTRLRGWACRIRTAESIDSFGPRAQIDQRFFDTPYVTPSEPVAQEAFAVIREAMRGKGMVALGRLVLSKRERVIALQAYGKGLLGTTVRYPYEVRTAEDYFCDLPELTIAPDMLTLGGQSYGGVPPQRGRGTLKEPRRTREELRQSRRANGRECLATCRRHQAASDARLVHSIQSTPMRCGTQSHERHRRASSLAARSIPASRASITSTLLSARSMPSARPVRHISRAKRTRAGG